MRFRLPVCLTIKMTSRKRKPSTEAKSEPEHAKKFKTSSRSSPPYKDWTFAEWVSTFGTCLLVHSLPMCQTAKYQERVWAWEAPADREDKEGNHLCPFCDVPYNIDNDNSEGNFPLPDHLRECKSPEWRHFKDK